MGRRRRIRRRRKKRSGIKREWMGGLYRTRGEYEKIPQTWKKLLFSLYLRT